MKPKKTWREKLAASKGLPKIVSIGDKMRKRWGTGTVFIPAPRQVDALMKKVPKGKVITINGISDVLAKKHGTTIGCPITTGIFAWVAAYAADEDAADGKKKITPYWRILKEGGEINPKYPGGASKISQLLEAEGHEITVKGKKLLVKDYEKKLVKIPNALQIDQRKQTGWKSRLRKKARNKKPAKKN
jgi:alkylated DNA nucleotide flippase Atl1